MKEKYETKTKRNETNRNEKEREKKKKQNSANLNIFFFKLTNDRYEASKLCYRISEKEQFSKNRNRILVPYRIRLHRCLLKPECY